MLLSSHLRRRLCDYNEDLFSFYLSIHMSGSILQSRSPMSRMKSASISSHCDSEVRRPHITLVIIKPWSFRQPNSEPATIQTFSLVLTSKQAFPARVTQDSKLLNSARNNTNLMNFKDTTLEYTLERGMPVRCMSAASLVLWRLSCFTLRPKWTLIF